MSVFTDPPPNAVTFTVCEEEYDSPELARLRSWLEENGWKLESSDWGVGGSQEVIEWQVVRGDARAVLVLETYMGVTVTADEETARLFEPIRRSPNHRAP